MIGKMRPGALVCALVVAQIVAWTLAPTLSHTALPLDVVEGAFWGREGAILSYKHPNLPGLLIEAAYRLTGAYGWPDYLLSQLFVGATYYLVYRLGRDLFGPVAGSAGALLLAGCFYFSWPTPEFNHNLAQMPIWAAFAFVLWRAVASNAPALWLIVGLVAALGMYAKFSTSVLLVYGVLWLLLDSRGRACLATRRPWLGLAFFAIAVTPLAVQLARIDFMPLTYAASRSGVGAGFWSFVRAQVADILGMLAITGFALLWPKRNSTNITDAAEVALVADRGRAGLFLAIIGLGPIAAAAAVAATFGAKQMWTAPMLNLVGLLIVLPLRRRLDRQVLTRIASAALALTIILPLGYAGALVVQPYLDAQRPPRALWPQAALSRRMTAIWSEATHSPLKIVGGDDWVAGLVGLDTPDRPSIYTGLDPRIAPWVTPERLAKQGVLVLWEDRGNGMPAGMQTLAAGNSHGEEGFAWSRSSKARPLKIGYIIIPPVVN